MNSLLDGMQGELTETMTSGTQEDTNPRRRSSAMIIDDQFTGRKILEELIQGIDPELMVESFSSPLEALERVNQQIPDLIITDYRMPELDGVEFIKRLRAIPECEDIPLIVVTVVEDPSVRYEALDAGATDFLVRPIDQHECRARCRNLLMMRKQQKIIMNRALLLEEQVAAETREIRLRERDSLLRLARVCEYRDEGSGNHILRIGRFSRIIAEALDLSIRECEEVELAAPLHDIGRVSIPDRILLSPEKLSVEDQKIMQSHTTIGHQLLADSPSRYLQLGAVIALTHHEKYDGSGYPQGLKGDEIPLAARIVAVADVYEALTTKRAYKSAWSCEKAVAYIQEESGKHFDPACVGALVSRIDAIRESGATLKDELPSG